MTEIEWTEVTWNPTAGCSIASPGCTNCYAMRMASRLEAMGVEKYRGLTRKTGGRAKWTGKISLDEKSLTAPLSWKKPRMVFVNSMSDLFHEKLSLAKITKVWDVMASTPQHTYQILTKRPERMAEFSQKLPQLSNVWLGTSVESAEFLPRLDALRRTQANVRFASFEPLIEALGDIDLKNIDWAIVGGESGPAARPMSEDWVHEIHDACRVYGTAFFFKQWGGVHKKKTGRSYKGRTFDEFPQSRVELS